MDGLDILNLVAELNSKANDPELERYGTASNWFEMRSNGSDYCVSFCGYPVWSSVEDTRNSDDSQPDGMEPLESYLLTEARRIREVMNNIPLFS